MKLKQSSGKNGTELGREIKMINSQGNNWFRVWVWIEGQVTLVLPPCFNSFGIIHRMK